MRKLIMWNVVTLDGCFEGEKPWDLDFHQSIFGKELQDMINEQLASASLLVFGENTYKGMADYWSKAEAETQEDVETIRMMNGLPKLVCSTTRTKAQWHNTTIAPDAVAAIAKLKKEGEGNIFVFGSAILSESLMQAGLFDEYRLAIAPVLLGKGRRLFTENTPHQNLKLLEDRPLHNSGVVVRYAPTK